ncbi:unnamed protein product [Protopolystoma xenopodis]|uniref:Rab-GAP TBC domain-containing protein n=1 Tax=Protopolystoma xenopodis TaxID=117903 RepID=A0A3S5CHL8_9PLAT|nr:unnamed protein product [Protopolystoma xenopodis]
MDTEKSELAERIAQTGSEINWKAAERRASYGEKTRKRKTIEASDILGEKNLMNKRLEGANEVDEVLSSIAAHRNGSVSSSRNITPRRRAYEPPLTNVYTIQWFLTLFSTTLPPEAVLRVWDSVLLEGSEVGLRTGLVIFSAISK